jgi:hypothetical protein
MNHTCETATSLKDARLLMALAPDIVSYERRWYLSLAGWISKPTWPCILRFRPSSSCKTLHSGVGTHWKALSRAKPKEMTRHPYSLLGSNSGRQSRGHPRDDRGDISVESPDWGLSKAGPLRVAKTSEPHPERRMGTKKQIAADSWQLMFSCGLVVDDPSDSSNSLEKPGLMLGSKAKRCLRAMSRV